MLAPGSAREQACGGQTLTLRPPAAFENGSNIPESLFMPQARLSRRVFNLSAAAAAVSVAARCRR